MPEWKNLSAVDHSCFTTLSVVLLKGGEEKGYMES